MRIILSRKGFDTQYGGQPSPILPDGTLLSLPIPSKFDKLKYSELLYNEKSYLDIIKELKPGTNIKDNYTCHLDPDLRKDATIRDTNWLPLFGQAKSPQGHLIKNGITKDDLFLFFGTFKATENFNGKLRYIKGAVDAHIIFGYLQIGNMYSDFYSFRPEVKYHPHAQDQYANVRSNCIYEASERLSIFETFEGAGCFTFHEDLVLTKKGYSKSRWNLPSFFKDVRISYHTKNSFTPDYFQSIAKGQEFVIEYNSDVQEWVKNIIKKGNIV